MSRDAMCFMSQITKIREFSGIGQIRSFEKRHVKPFQKKEGKRHVKEYTNSQKAVEWLTKLLLWKVSIQCASFSDP